MHVDVPTKQSQALTPRKALWAGRCLGGAALRTPVPTPARMAGRSLKWLTLTSRLAGRRMCVGGGRIDLPSTWCVSLSLHNYSSKKVSFCTTFLPNAVGLRLVPMTSLDMTAQGFPCFLFRFWQVSKLPHFITRFQKMPRKFRQVSGLSFANYSINFSSTEKSIHFAKRWWCVVTEPRGELHDRMRRFGGSCFPLGEVTLTGYQSVCWARGRLRTRVFVI